MVLSGHSRLTGGSTSGQPASSSLPNQYLRWELEPRLTIYGVPITAHALLTTESDTDRRSMNSITLGFDVKAFQAMLRERVMEAAKGAEADLRAKAEEMRAKLSDPSVAADLARVRELEAMDATGLLADSARAGLEELRAKTAEARKVAEAAERYASMDPAAMAKEKEKELRALKRELADPSKLESRLEEMNLLSGVESFLFGIQDLGLGVTYPSYSPFVLSGMPVNGASLEYNTGIFTFAAAGGSADGPIPDARVALQTFDRGLVAGKIGLGATSGTHFHLMGLYVDDDGASAKPDSAYTPAENYVLAADARLDLFDRAITIAAQASGSMLTRNVAAPGIEVESKDDPTGLGIVRRLDPNVSSSADYAWSLETAFNLFDGATIAKAGARMVGPGYASLGVPYLRTDVLGYEAQLEQRLFDGQVSFGGYYKQNEDNILPWKRTRVGEEWLPVRTTLTSYGARAGVQFRGLPYLRVEYAPFLQQSDIEGEGSGSSNQTELINLSAGYAWSLADLSGATTATALLQEGSSHDGAHGFRNNVYLVNQTVGFSFPLSLTAGGSYTETNVAGRLTKITAINGSGSIKVSDFLKATLGLTYSDRNDGGSRLGFSVRTAIDLWGYAELDLRAERSAYESGISADEGYEQLRFRGIVTTRW